MPDVKVHPFHEFPKHMYHASKPPIHALNSTDQEKALKDGYGYEYIAQEFPKAINRKAGRPAFTANNAEEEKRLIAVAKGESDTVAPAPAAVV